MSPVETTKEAYTSPEMNSYELVTQGSLLQVVSNPGGAVPPIDPDEE